MRKKELLAGNDQLRLELSQANRLAASQTKQINEQRMELALMDLAPVHRSVGYTQGVRDAGGAPGLGQRCSLCGQPSFASAQELVVKACPDCAEEVRVAARKCRFCNYSFEGVERPRTENGAKDVAASSSAPVARLGTVAGA
jgi:Uncharacterised protein family UPF0547.